MFLSGSIRERLAEVFRFEIGVKKTHDEKTICTAIHGIVPALHRYTRLSSHGSLTGVLSRLKAVSRKQLENQGQKCAREKMEMTRHRLVKGRFGLEYRAGNAGVVHPMERSVHRALTFFTRENGCEMLLENLV